jgi:prolipoprotein diacylglyceryltransferase
MLGKIIVFVIVYGIIRLVWEIWQSTKDYKEYRKE